MRNIVSSVILLSALAACSPEEPAPADCTAADHQALIGQSETVLETMKFAVPLRVIHPGDMVTGWFSRRGWTAVTSRGRSVFMCLWRRVWLDGVWCHSGWGQR